MTPGISLQQTADGIAVAMRREELANLRSQIAALSAELSGLRGELRLFEDRYFREVGILYAELDRLHAEIAEREVDLYDSDEARERAKEARRQAEESQQAVESESFPEAEFDPPASLRTLFRDVAKRIHPDFARDEAEAEYLTLLMARANQAYRAGDTHFLQQMLQDHRDLAECEGNENAFEIARLLRQIQHAQRDMSALESERQTLLSSDIAHMHADAQSARNGGRDLLAELASSVREQVEAAHARVLLVDRQVSAHGR